MDESERTLRWYVSLTLLISVTLLAGRTGRLGWEIVLSVLTLFVGLRCARAVVAGKIPADGLMALLLGIVLVLSGWTVVLNLLLLARAVSNLAYQILEDHVAAPVLYWAGSRLAAVILIGVIAGILLRRSRST